VNYIQYGFPAFTDDELPPNVELGGCLVPGDNGPTHTCRTCGTQFHDPETYQQTWGEELGPRDERHVGD
jgi:hypothetical protein